MAQLYSILYTMPVGKSTCMSEMVKSAKVVNILMPQETTLDNQIRDLRIIRVDHHILQPASDAIATQHGCSDR